VLEAAMMMGAVVIMVIVTTLVTPPLLKMAMARKPRKRPAKTSQD